MAKYMLALHIVKHLGMILNQYGTKNSEGYVLNYLMYWVGSGKTPIAVNS